MIPERIRQNPWLIFLPFLFVYILFVIFSPTYDHGDEARYLMFAQNLLHGFYSPPAPDINLTNGPGWPIVLMPFVAFGNSLLAIKIANAVFYYLSVVFLYKAIRKLTGEKPALVFSFAWASYYIAYQNMPYAHTETFTYFLVSTFLYFFIRVFEESKSRKLDYLMAGFFLGYIVLTKVAFGYVLLSLVAGSGILFLLNRHKTAFKKGFHISLIALMIVLPYMIYIYQLTGRVFYWSTTAGSTLYWASTPYEGEYGDWKLELKQGPKHMGNYNIPGVTEELVKNHQQDYNEVYAYKGVEQDDAFKRLAFKNIREHPLKYLQNCVYNAGRLVFHYPFSKAEQRPKTLLVFPLNGIVLTLILFSLLMSLNNWQQLPYSIKYLMFFTALYLGVSILVTAYVRMFTIIVPILMLWFSYIFSKAVKIKWKLNA